MYNKDIKYNPQIWADLNSEERNIYYIAEAFLNFAKSKNDFTKFLPSAETKSCPNYERDGLRPADSIRNHKNWEYFGRVWERFKNDPTFDADIYLKSISRHISKDQKLYPAQLATKKNFDYYIEYRESLKFNNSKSDDNKKIMEGIIQTYKLIANKVGVKKLTQQNLYDFFNKPKSESIISEGLLFCIQEMISPYYFSVSKSFIAAYKNSDKDIQNEILEIERLKDMHRLTIVNKKVYDFLKKVFDGDIV